MAISKMAKSARSGVPVNLGMIENLKTKFCATSFSAATRDRVVTQQIWVGTHSKTGQMWWEVLKRRLGFTKPEGSQSESQNGSPVPGSCFT